MFLPWDVNQGNDIDKLNKKSIIKYRSKSLFFHILIKAETPEKK